ncbi:MAG TPA: hypothetical protein ENK75_06485 [Saprospiraceae bacterium]|nr:hypothetical protein [Saprospiraceae bacterium]
MDHINTIDYVLTALDEIILHSKQNNDTLGYFAALYRNVTQQVKNGIAENKFENGVRMAKLDVIFAKRYLSAYEAFKAKKATTLSWEKAFDNSTRYLPIVLQHLLLGMTAHISLDLGIAAAEVSKDQSLEDLHADFNKINNILAALVEQVEQDLTRIWPTWHKILKFANKSDKLIVNFSMQLARDGAWKFANQIFGKPDVSLEVIIKERDQKVANISNIITQPGVIAQIILFFIRIGERGTIAQKIKELEH